MSFRMFPVTPCVAFLLVLLSSSSLQSQEWEPFGPPGGLAVHFAYDTSTGTLYSGGGLHVYSLKKGGTEWEPKEAFPWGGTNDHIPLLDLKYTSKGLIAVMRSGEMFISDDSSGEWEQLPSVKTLFRLDQNVLAELRDTVFMIDSSQTTLMMSVDGARSWTTIDALPFTARSIVADESTLYLAADDGLYRREEDGSWDMIGPNTEIVHNVVLSADMLVIGTVGSGMYRSSDQGETWEHLPGSQSLYRFTVDNGTIWAGGKGRVYKIGPDEKQWSEAARSLESDLSIPPQNIAVVEGKVYAAFTYGMRVVEPELGELSPFDQGRNEHLINGIVSSGDTLVYCPVYANGVYLTDPEGRSWIFRKGPIRKAFSDLCEANGRLYGIVALEDTVYVSDDNALTWSAHPFNTGGPFRVRAIDASGDSVVVSGQQGVLISANGGMDWRSADVESPLLLSAINLSGDTIIAATQSSTGQAEIWIFRSFDFGETWSRTAPLPERLAKSSMQFFDGHLFATGWGPPMYRSTDYGDTWDNIYDRIPTPPALGTPYLNVGVLKADDGKLYIRMGSAVGGQMQYWLFVSEDLGMSWSQYPISSAQFFSSHSEYSVVAVEDYLMMGTQFGGYRTKKALSVGMDRSAEIAAVESLNLSYDVQENAVRWRLEESRNVRVNLYRIDGAHVGVLLDGALEAGEQRLDLTGLDLSSGVYFVTLETAELQVSTPLVLQR